MRNETGYRYSNILVFQSKQKFKASLSLKYSVLTTNLLTCSYRQTEKQDPKKAGQVWVTLVRVLNLNLS